jgi:protein-S-isoprenylcysteine O-methyltransferase Ste14
LVAFVLILAFGVFALGLRGWVHWRRTGDLPFRGSAGMHGVVAMLAILGTYLAGPVLDVADVLPRLAHGRWVTGVGVVLAGAGIVATLWAQFAMGESWRVGVDTEERTALITTGPFRWVRNPIYTAMLLFTVGLALVVPNAVSVAALAAVVITLEYHVRAVEEPYLARVHGAAYTQWAARAGRFVPGLGRFAH